MVRMLLIGGGAGGYDGGGGGGAGGGSGATTSWIGPAMFVPNVLRILVGAGGAPNNSGNNTVVQYQAKNSAGYSLLTANGAAASTGGTLSTVNAFGSCGIFKSVAGQNGAAADSSVNASASTFLSGGAGGASTSANNGGDVTSKYGYPDVLGGNITLGTKGGDGYFLLQPIMVGYGGAGGSAGTGTGPSGGKGGIGCGGGGGGPGGSGGQGGDGAVFIWSW